MRNILSDTSGCLRRLTGNTGRCALDLGGYGGVVRPLGLRYHSAGARLRWKPPALTSSLQACGGISWTQILQYCSHYKFDVPFTLHRLIMTFLWALFHWAIKSYAAAAACLSIRIKEKQFRTKKRGGLVQQRWLWNLIIRSHETIMSVDLIFFLLLL